MENGSDMTTKPKQMKPKIYITLILVQCTLALSFVSQAQFPEFTIIDTGAIYTSTGHHVASGWFDMDNDNYMDVIITNSSGYNYTGHLNLLYKNELPFKVTRITGGINFDGIPDEPFWQSVEALPMIMLNPVFGIEPSEESVIKIAYDDEYFYVSGWLTYNNSSDIRAVGKKRDYSSSSTDFIGFILDTYNDKENAVSFHTNPNGLRTDGTVKNDCADWVNDISFSWNTFWDVKTHISDNGWSAEFRIPFSSLRFQVNKGKTQMGLLLMRYCAAKAEFATWPISSPDYPYAFWKPSLCAEIEFEGLDPKNPVYVTPYVTAGVNQANVLNEQGTAYKMNSTFKKDAGLDVKYSLTNNLTADITLNTDFAR